MRNRIFRALCYVYRNAWHVISRDKRTIYIYIYIYIHTIAQCRLVYVGLAQARPNHQYRIHIACRKDRHVYALVLSTWCAVNRSMAGHMVKQGHRMDVGGSHWPKMNR